MRDVSPPLNPWVPVSLVLAFAVVEALTAVDEMLANDVLATLAAIDHRLGNNVIEWPLRFAVRVQLALTKANASVAEPMGRCIDQRLSASADGVSFKPWSTTPLAPLSSPVFKSASPNASQSRQQAATSVTSPDYASPGLHQTPMYPPKDRPKPPKARQESARGKSAAMMVSTVCAVVACTVNLDFSLLGTAAPALQVADVPTNETIKSLATLTAGLFDVDTAEVSFLSEAHTAVNPRVQLSSLVEDSTVLLKVVPNTRVGGDRPPIQGMAADLPDGPLAAFAFNAPTPQPMEVEAPQPQLPPQPEIPEPSTLQEPEPSPRQLEPALPQLPPPLYPPHQGRRRVEQPEPSHNPNQQRPNRRWSCFARWEQLRTGKAARADVWELKESSKLWASTREEVVQKREAVLLEVLHPKSRAAKTGKRFAPTEERAPREGKRAATPDSLSEPKLMPYGPSHERARAGPGRGHKYEPAHPLREQLTLPSPEALAGASWFEQIRLKKEWQTKRMAELEAQVEMLLVENERLTLTVEALRQRV